MNRISRRSAAEAAEALLEAGRTQPVLNYDVELGLERHHDWLRSEAPMPEWASAGTAAKSMVPFVAKTLVSSVLVGALGIGAWYAKEGQQPSAARSGDSSPVAERAHQDPPSVPELPAPEVEARMATTPIPISDHGPTSDEPARGTVRTELAEKRTARVHRAGRTRESRSARAASAPGAVAKRPRSAAELPSSETVGRATAPRSAGDPERASGPLDATAAGAASATAMGSPSEDTTAEHATRREVAAAAAPERKRSAPQRPDDLLEMQQVASAEQLLERSPARALALVRQGDQRFARGYFQQERAYIAIMALIRLGRIEEARARAASFAKQFPPLPYGARIRSALEAREAAVPSAASRDAVP